MSLLPLSAFKWGSSMDAELTAINIVRKMGDRGQTLTTSEVNRKLAAAGLKTSAILNWLIDERILKKVDAKNVVLDKYLAGESARKRRLSIKKQITNEVLQAATFAAMIHRENAWIVDTELKTIWQKIGNWRSRDPETNRLWTSGLKAALKSGDLKRRGNDRYRIVDIFAVDIENQFFTRLSEKDQGKIIEHGYTDFVQPSLSVAKLPLQIGYSILRGQNTEALSTTLKTAGAADVIFDRSNEQPSLKELLSKLSSHKDSLVIASLEDLAPDLSQLIVIVKYLTAHCIKLNVLNLDLFACEPDGTPKPETKKLLTTLKSIEKTTPVDSFVHTRKVGKPRSLTPAQEDSLLIYLKSHTQIETAQQFRVSRRTVNRIVKAAKSNQASGKGV